MFIKCMTLKSLFMIESFWTRMTFENWFFSTFVLLMSPEMRIVFVRTTARRAEESFCSLLCKIHKNKYLLCYKKKLRITLNILIFE